MKYHVAGVIEVDVIANSPEEAAQLAENRIYAALDKSARRLNAAIGMDTVTIGDSATNILDIPAHLRESSLDEEEN